MHWIQQPEEFYAQKRLAQEVVSFLRGKDAVKRAEFVSEIFFGNGDLSQFKV